MFQGQALLTRVIWTLLALFAAYALIRWRLEVGMVALVTLGLSMAPVFVAKWAEIEVPRGFIAATTMFVGGTLFLGEVFQFYYRFWWWDIAMHGGSAIGFGLIGFILVFMMFQGDRYAAPPIAMAFFAFCFAMTIGSIWEIFEFGMDQIFGTNMQKSGLMDTMGDLIVDAGGALLGSALGFAWLKGQNLGGLTGAIQYFVQKNPKMFSRFRRPRS
ncbi:hypothetical protein ATO6_11065 [Oceanicola sp. 22II-s10i]|uniref:hypothetical protein n=1 Tax=Oceanicola sp. 22II-s10i TaxID=1317116 RepID=UPI000B522078|nr:hypothetical protein [Oceanicola sp. 22II-s10i]OWU84846.1 hypothetical protein ATO6_11065 [Oceanicola sp. 22II-s10i]